MRTVFPGHMVYDVWAKQSQYEGRNAGGSQSFRGNLAYSYGATIAAIVTNATGERAVLLTTHHYSVTTSKHQSYVFSAALSTGLPIFHVRDVASVMTHVDNLAYFAAELDRLDGKRRRARVHGEWYETGMARVQADADGYVRFFGLADTFTPELAERLLAERRERQEAEIARRERRRQRERAKARKLYAEEARAWQAGGPLTENVQWRYPDTILRVERSSLDGREYVVTNRNYSATMADARELYDAIVAGDRDHVHAGHYVRMERGMVHIGCQAIRRKEIDRLAHELGWDRSEIERHAPAQVA